MVAIPSPFPFLPARLCPSVTVPALPSWSGTVPRGTAVAPPLASTPVRAPLFRLPSACARMREALSLLRPGLLPLVPSARTGLAGSGTAEVRGPTPTLSPAQRARLSAARADGGARGARRANGGPSGPGDGGPPDAGAGGAPGPEEARRLCALARAAVEGVSDLEPLAVRRLVEPTPRGLQHRRQIAMYVAHVGFGVRAIDVARCFGRDTTTAYHAFRQVEDMRDDGRVDAFLDAVEALVTAARSLATGEETDRPRHDGDGA